MPRRWFQVGGVIAILLIVLNISLTLRNAEKLRNDAQLVSQAHELQTELQTLQALLTDAESGQRGYLLTGDRSFLSPYDIANSKADQQIDRILNLAGEKERPQVELLRLSVKQRLSELGEVVQWRDNNNKTAVTDLVRENETAAVAGKVRDLLNSIERDADMILSRRSLNTSSTYWTSILSTLISGLAALGAIGSFAILSRKFIEERKQSESQREQQRSAEASLRETEKNFQMLADNMSQFAWMADASGWIYWYNKRWYDYTGTSLEEMQGWGWKAVHHPDHVERVVEKIQASWESGVPWEDTFPLRGKDGEYRWFLSRALPIRDESGEIVTWFGSNTDITDLKQYEESLQVARVAAENANNSRGEFLANMSHEIRTPMTAILGHADILRDHLTDPDDLQAIDTIQRNGKFLLDIINDILDLSKIDAGKFKVDHDRVEPAAIMADVRSLMDVRAQERGIAFDIVIDGKLPKSIETDPIRLRQILLNLVGNAIKFTDVGKVTLTARFVSSINRMEFAVSDTGIGISAEDQSKLFQPFMQADASSTRAYEGTGLGLAISRRLAHALGGDISVKSALGCGSTFTVSIDCGSLADVELVEPCLNLRTESDTAERPPHIDARLLVVDDRRDIRFLAQHFLERAGAEVVTATTGAEAVERLLNASPNEPTIDLVVMDMQMPIMDGYEATRVLRSRGFTQPIIALTANAMKEDREKCLAAGCNAYATKPLDGLQLVRLVEKHLVEKNLVEKHLTETTNSPITPPD